MDGRKCTSDSNFSLTKCVQNYIANEVGCSLNWFTVTNHSKEHSNFLLANIAEKFPEEKYGHYFAFLPLTNPSFYGI